jgi:hypothetical protein
MNDKKLQRYRNRTEELGGIHITGLLTWDNGKLCLSLPDFGGQVSLDDWMAGQNQDHKTYCENYVCITVRPAGLVPACRPEGRHNAHQVMGKIGTEPVTGGRLSDPTPRAADNIMQGRGKYNG